MISLLHQLSIFLFLFVVSPLYASDGKAIIDRMVQKLRGHSNIATYELTVHRPSWGRTVKLKVWDDRATKRLFIRILEPPKDAGISFLRIGYNLWNYLPKVEKVMKIPPSMMLQPWMGSDFTNDDLAKESSYVDDYDHAIVGEEVRDGEGVWRIELIPHPRAPVVWGKVIFWVRKKDSLPMEQHFLDDHGRLVKDLIFQDFKVMDGILMPTLWEMKPLLKAGQKTTLRLHQIDFDPPISDAIFSQEHLRF